MSLGREIKQVLGLLSKAIKQTPLDKQPFLTHKVTRVVQKYGQLNPTNNEASYLRELEFNLNFIRLSFPHLDYTQPEQAEENNIDKERVESEFMALENEEEVRKFVKQTEEALKGAREQVEFSNWSTDNLDPQDLKRHKELLKRQYFGGEFWKGREKPISPTSAFLMNMMESAKGPPSDEKIVVQQQSNQGEDVHTSGTWQKVKR